METVLSVLEQTGAILDGHYLLSSGFHSPRYVQCALVLQHPDKAQWLGGKLAGLFQRMEPQTVIAPAIGGIILAHEVARALGVRAIFAERKQARMDLRRGFRLSPGERVVVVEDVVTTAESLNEVIQIAMDQGAHVMAAGSILHRGRDTVLPEGIGFHTLLRLEIPLFPPTHCPMCQDRIPITAPGTRQSG